MSTNTINTVANRSGVYRVEYEVANLARGGNDFILVAKGEDIASPLLFGPCDGVYVQRVGVAFVCELSRISCGAMLEEIRNWDTESTGPIKSDSERDAAIAEVKTIDSLLERLESIRDAYQSVVTRYNAQQETAAMHAAAFGADAH